ncbi:MAG: hypothetical protein WD801_14130 [Gemmatimonadaceae bacterium]
MTATSHGLRAMGTVRACASVLVSVVFVGCAPPDAEPVSDSPGVAAPPVATSSPARRGAWSEELGRALLVPAHAESLAIVLFPDDATAPHPTLDERMSVTLHNAGGDTSVASASSEGQQCGDAPIVRLTGTLLPGWSVGLPGRSARVLSVDSIEALSGADSSRVTTSLARVASTLTAREESRFSGLPFSVKRARRFRLEGREVVMAHLVRRVPQESAPLEEHTFLIVERPSGGGGNEPFVIAHSRRSDGSEENAEYFEVLAVLQGRGGVFLLLARDRLQQITYEMLERSGPGSWTVRWSRALGC